MRKLPGSWHTGAVVGVAGDKLTTTCSEGELHTHTMSKDVVVTCDGRVCKAADLRAGTPVQVTTHQDDAKVAVAVDSGKHIRMSTKLG